MNTITIRSHTDLIEALPLIYGYTPTNSLAVLLMDDTGTTSKGIRIDLNPEPRHLDNLLQVLIAQAGTGAGWLHAVAYSEDTTTAEATLVFLTTNWPAELPTRLGLLANAGTTSWASVDPTNPQLCVVRDRRPYPDGTSVLAAAAAYAGITRHHTSRADLAATLTAPDPAEAAAFTDQVRHVSNQNQTPAGVAAMRDWMDAWIGDGYPSVDRDTAAGLTAAVQHLDTRDTAWASITRADAHHHIDLWRGIARQVDGTTALPVLSLTAAAAWISGNGTLANLALERADRLPGAGHYSMLELFHQILTAGLDPQAWTNLKHDITQALDQLEK